MVFVGIKDKSGHKSKRSTVGVRYLVVSQRKKENLTGWSKVKLQEEQEVNDGHRNQTMKEAKRGTTLQQKLTSPYYESYKIHLANIDMYQTSLIAVITSCFSKVSRWSKRHITCSFE